MSQTLTEAEIRAAFAEPPDPPAVGSGFPPPGLPRLAEWIAAALVLALLAPLLALAALLVRLEGPGPVTYRQRRVGLGEVEFDLIKLRTMRPGSDPVGVGTAVGAADPRVTRAGALLRRFSIDELPNLLNVLRGEMSLVGPATRPARPPALSERTPTPSPRGPPRDHRLGAGQRQGRDRVGRADRARPRLPRPPLAAARHDDHRANDWRRQLRRGCDRLSTVQLRVDPSASTSVPGGVRTRLTAPSVHPHATSMRADTAHRQPRPATPRSLNGLTAGSTSSFRLRRPRRAGRRSRCRRRSPRNRHSQCRRRSRGRRGWRSRRPPRRSRGPRG